jgi:hypothetical protein
MGLDMYLFKLKNSKDFPAKIFIKICWHFYSLPLVQDEDIKHYLSKFTYEVTNEEGTSQNLVCKVGYWRKANMIHNWIYQNCAACNQQDYEHIIVERGKLEELLKICRTILINRDSFLCGNTELAKSKLPTKSGFFFGSLEYNEDYLEDIEETVVIIESTLAKLEEDEVIFYLADY